MDFELARKKMVDNQIRANKVTDLKIIDAFKYVQREKFVPNALKERVRLSCPLTVPTEYTSIIILTKKYLQRDPN